MSLLWVILCELLHRRNVFRQVSWSVWRWKSISVYKALACLLLTMLYIKRLHTCQSPGLSFNLLFLLVESQDVMSDLCIGLSYLTQASQPVLDFSSRPSLAHLTNLISRPGPTLFPAKILGPAWPMSLTLHQLDFWSQEFQIIMEYETN